MDRRDFFKLSSLVLLAPLLGNCGRLTKNNFPIEVKSNRSFGHQIFSQLQNAGTSAPIKTNYLVVGGGIAGLAAAVKLKKEDFYLLELDNQIGGSSSAGEFDHLKFAQGAHYELSYPSNYGEEVLSFLNQLEIVYHDRLTDQWKFKDKQYLIDKSSESLCKEGALERTQLLPQGTASNQFMDLLLPYDGQMVMPTRLIDPSLRELDKQSFYNFLNTKINLTSELAWAIDYQLKDDYGAGSNTVSALAGIHYYMCRPYHKKEVELFSPPQGNFYFADKMLAQLPKERIKTGHLVYNITEEKKGFRVKVLDLTKQLTLEVFCNKIIYAGQKHSLKHVFPKYQSLFQDNTYAPWVVVNIITKNFYTPQCYWQNELITNKENNFMGFVDSKSQAITNTNYRVFTAYFCYPYQNRKLLLELEQEPTALVNNVINTISDFLNENIKEKVVKACVNVMGHAMPIPKANYLFPDQLPTLSTQNMAFAGVDTGRLPLLFEALDSGIVASIE